MPRYNLVKWNNLKSIDRLFRDENYSNNQFNRSISNEGYIYKGFTLNMAMMPKFELENQIFPTNITDVISTFG